jgi:transposase
MPSLGQRCLDPALCDGSDTNEVTGCPADAPQVLLTMGLCASSRGILSSRTIGHACRAHLPLLALSCGLVPDHRTSAPVGSSLPEEMVSLCRDMLLVREAQGV